MADHYALQKQFQWRGNSLADTGLLVCKDCLDFPQDQFRNPILPADPRPIINPRPSPNVTPIPILGQPLPASPQNLGFTVYNLGASGQPGTYPATQASALASVLANAGVSAPSGLGAFTQIMPASVSKWLLAPDDTRTFLLIYNPNVVPVQFALSATAVLGTITNLTIGPGEAFFWSTAQGLGTVYQGSIAAISQYGGNLPLWFWADDEGGFWNDGGVMAFIDAGDALGWPTNDTGLVPGALWNNGLTLAVVPGGSATGAPPVYFGQYKRAAVARAGRGEPADDAGCHRHRAALEQRRIGLHLMTVYPNPQFADYAINCQAPPYNADPTGATDSTAAIQAALTAGAGGSVFLPSGTYLISANMFVRSGTDFFGAGNSSILQMSVSSWGSLPPSSQPNSAYIMLSNYGGSALPNSDANITVRDMWLKGNPYASGTAWGVNGTLLRFIGVTNPVARNLRFTYNNLGVGIVNCSGFVIENIIHDYLNGFATSVWWGSQQGIIKNIIGTTNGATSAAAGVIQINAANNSNAGPNLITKDIDVSGVLFNGAATTAVQVFPVNDGVGNQIQNITLRGINIHETSGTNSAIAINGACSGISLSDFIITGVARSNPALLFQEDAGFSQYPHGVTVSDGTFQGCTIGGAAPLIEVLYADSVAIDNISAPNSTYPYAIAFASTATNVAVSNTNATRRLPVNIILTYMLWLIISPELSHLP